MVGGGWGHWNADPDNTMSRIRVSMGVLPTRRAKNSCSITADETVLKLGRRSKSLPKRVGWLGYWVLQYSSKAHWDFSCNCSIICVSLRPGASGKLDSLETLFTCVKMTQLLPTCGEKNYSFHQGVFSRVYMKQLQLLNLFLEYPDVVHKCNHSVCSHGRRVKPGSYQ